MCTCHIDGNSKNSSSMFYRTFFSGDIKKNWQWLLLRSTDMDSDMEHDIHEKKWEHGYSKDTGKKYKY